MFPFILSLTAQEVEERLNSISNKLDKDVIRQSLANPSSTTVPSTQAMADVLGPLSEGIEGLGILAGKDSVALDTSEVTGVLPISKGGTGALSLEQAQQNLGILSEEDITTLIESVIPEIGDVQLDSAQTSGILPISKGGSGAQTTQQARINLGVWSASQSETVRDNVNESLRRSYAEAGYNVVGTFREGFTIVNSNDVGIDEATGKGFTGPAGPVAAGTDPASGGFVDVSGATMVGPSVADVLASRVSVGGSFTTYRFNRPCVCDWEVTGSEETGSGKFSVYHPLSGLWLSLRPRDAVSPAMVGAIAGAVDNTAAVQKAFTFNEVHLDGVYGVSGATPISVLAGQVVTSINGPLTGSAIKAGLIALSPMSLMVDLSQAKYADVAGLISDGATIAQRGFKATNVFGLNMELCRAFNLTVSGYEFVNDGVGVGSFINSLTKCFASNVPEGFTTSSSGSESNLFVYSQCVATDCASYGFREFGNNTGRDNAYNDCDAERCGIGMLLRSRNFSVTNPYIEFCGKGIVVDATGLAVGVQSGSISSPSILGKFGFPDIPSEDTTGIELIGYCRNVVINNPWVAYHKKGIVAASAVKGLSITDPFIENCETKYDILTKSYRISSGNKESSSVVLVNTDTTITDENNTIFIDIVNNNRTYQIETSDWLVGQSLEIVVIGSTGSTGSLTVTGTVGTPLTFFGQNKGAKISGVSSISVPYGTVLKLIKQSAGTVYFYAIGTA